ncbi:MAG: HDIG domain-containing protein [Actinobacteria bacterium]|nr:MAG: HDIG domain-containing protein [Actinomycetota bacterium]
MLRQRQYYHKNIIQKIAARFSWASYFYIKVKRLLLAIFSYKDYNLLELMRPNQPIILKLMRGAPGTYNHSLAVANLVDSVSGEIGADSLLCRAAAIYHDIGKISRPYFFNENQTGFNPHDKTKAKMSYLIITAHVRDGAEIARKSHLPKEIIDIILQHHGNGLVSYFYEEAKKKQEHVKESDFRYHEKIPQSKEAALVMLADSVEAACRSIAKPCNKSITSMVEGVINSRLEDHQLDNSTLTVSDLNLIKKKFSMFLVNVYHPRIKYPACRKAGPGKVIPLRSVNSGNRDK